MAQVSPAMLTEKLALLLLLGASVVLASETCFYCRGINCQRTSYQAIEACVDQLDACVSVFEAGRVKAQGCLQQLEPHLRQLCDERPHCATCVTERCNQLSLPQLACLQCNDGEDELCRTAPQELAAQACGIARSGRSLCYASIKDQRVERGCALTLAEQRACLADANCVLCDPSEIEQCNGQPLEESLETTQPPSTSTSASPSTSTPSPASPSTSSPVPSSSFSTSTLPPPTDPTTPQPGSAQSLWTRNIPILLLVLQLAAYLYAPQ